jgi:serine/threonine-protein kinase HipA
MARALHALDLWMNGARVGTWTQRGDSHVLAYDSSWSASPDGRPLSLSLPLLPAGGVHRGAAVSAYFENLLPDSSQIRRRLRERFSARSTAAFDLLAEIGRDCVGAVQLLPTGGDPGDVRRIDAEPLDDHAVAQQLRGVATVAGVGQRADAGFRISLAGAQEKTALLRHEGAWCLPRGSTPTTHLFKLPLGRVGTMQADFSSSVENEWLCSEIVRAFGLAIARTEMGRFEDQKALLVERFDRRLAPGGSWWLRLPQEDLCQAHGLSPEARYEVDGGPGVPTIMQLLSASESADADRHAFFKAQMLFWLLAATDGHAKNFSLHLGPRGSFRMAPLYDVMSVYPVLGRGRNQIDAHQASLAMAVVSKNRHYALHEILPRHWLAMGRRCGVDARAIADELCTRAPAAIATVAAMLPTDFPVAVSEPIFTGLAKAASELHAGLPP